MKHVLLADKVSDEVLQGLERLRLHVTNRPDLTAEQLTQAIADCDILVVRSTEVHAAAIEQGHNLALIVRAGAGVNTIDVVAASARGIYVANCPGVNSAAVAELAIGLLLAADRRIVDACVDLRNGRWRKKEYAKARGVKGRTLGILGWGAIGREVAERAKALEMRIVAWSRSLTPELADSLDIGFAATPCDLASQADAVSIHLALTPDTRRLVNDEFLSHLRPGSILVNTARGEIVDTEALRQAIRDRGIKAALDVFADEPQEGDAAFLDTPLAASLTGTPHIGASTDQTSEAIGREVVRIIREYVERGNVPGAVNILERTPATHTLVVRHYNRVGVLATILDGLRQEQINVEEMQNRIMATAAAAVCVLAIDSPPSASFLETLARDPNILQVTLGEHTH